MKCKRCGCADEAPCKDGCAWISHDPPICSACVTEDEHHILEFIQLAVARKLAGEARRDQFLCAALTGLLAHAGAPSDADVDKVIDTAIDVTSVLVDALVNSATNPPLEDELADDAPRIVAP